MSISDREFADAIEQGQKDAEKFAFDARFDGREIYLKLESGEEIHFSPELAEGLAGAPRKAIESLTLTPLGDVLFFPDLGDLAFYVPALADKIYGSVEWTSAHERG
jgi:hypothetical protein